jgi:hypothetical protein
MTEHPGGRDHHAAARPVADQHMLAERIEGIGVMTRQVAAQQRAHLAREHLMAQALRRAQVVDAAGQRHTEVRGPHHRVGDRHRRLGQGLESHRIHPVTHRASPMGREHGGAALRGGYGLVAAGCQA